MNKKVLAILLLLSIVLVLYPSMTALINAQNALIPIGQVNEFPIFDETFVAVRNNLIMQNLGFIFLYLFLGLGLHYYKPTSPQTESAQPNESVEPQETKSTMKVKVSSRKINPQWAFFVGSIVSIMVIVWQLVTNPTLNPYDSIMVGLTFSVIFYGIIVGCVVGIAFYVITR